MRPSAVLLGSIAGRSASLTAHGAAGRDTDLPADRHRGSTRLWEAEPEAMEVALQQHDRLLTEVIEGHGGAVITSRGEGDSFFAVFPSAVSAVEAAGVCQSRLAGEMWPAGSALRVRMGLHTGRCGCAAVIIWTTRRLTGVLECGRPVMAGRCCSPRPRGIWWRAVWVPGSG